MAVKPLGAVEPRVELPISVGEAGNYVKPQETVEARLPEVRHLPLVIGDRIVRRDEVVGRAVVHNDFAALRPKFVEAHVAHIHDGGHRCDPRLPLLRIEFQRIELRIAGDDVFHRLIADGIEQGFLAGKRIGRLRHTAEVRRVLEQRAFQQRPFRKRIHTGD
jgi:hypothetical protein